VHSLVVERCRLTGREFPWVLPFGLSQPQRVWELLVGPSLLELDFHLFVNGVR
jgi:hypothetical protein